MDMPQEHVSASSYSGNLLGSFLMEVVVPYGLDMYFQNDLGYYA